ncbi:glutathione S-transferase, partial [Phenoliferia sp. Uapishka_3]
MSSEFTLYTHASGPNGWKIATILKALGLSYDSVYLDFNKVEHKGEEYTAKNPNGRIPTLVHNASGFTLWESGAIITYLVEKYDTEHRISAATPEEKYKQLQWLFFQASGQGPYFGQAAWFKLFHSEKIPSAIERYEKEIGRVTSVLEKVLSQQPYLLGDKLTVADLAFISWNNFAFGALLPAEVDLKTQYPAVYAWHNKLSELEYVKATNNEKAALANH